jgi:predicted DNA-binding WGR domain protein
MPIETTYLELSEDGGASHKFYEVAIDDTTVTIRYGRIGSDGAKQTETLADADAAKKFADKKIAEKKKKGYAEAVMGMRKKRTVTRRFVSAPMPSSTSSSSSPYSRPAKNKPAPPVPKERVPLLWNFSSGSAAFGIFINEEACWVGNEHGRVFKLNHQGEVLTQYTLPDGVKCVIADKNWIYVGCDDGKVYDLTGKVPRVAYEINDDIDIYWLDIYNGLLGVSDAEGNVILANYEGDEIGRRKGKGTSAWMIRLDEQNIYYGDNQGMACFSLEDGSDSWVQNVGSVLFGWQEKDAVYAGTGRQTIAKVSKAGELLKTYQADGTIFSCATSENGKFVFGGDSSNFIYCFNEAGERLWKLHTNCGTALSMQYFQEKLYIVTNYGSLACIDASEEAIEKAKTGELPQTIQLKAPEAIAVAETMTLETIAPTAGKVILKCVKADGKLRVQVESQGYNASWFVQFPNNLRQEGKLYAVDGLQEASQGGFYRVLGEIYQLSLN